MRERERGRERERDRERERGRGREGGRERERSPQRERASEREREKDKAKSSSISRATESGGEGGAKNGGAVGDTGLAATFITEFSLENDACATSEASGGVAKARGGGGGGAQGEELWAVELEDYDDEVLSLPLALPLALLPASSVWAVEWKDYDDEIFREIKKEHKTERETRTEKKQRYARST